MQKRNPSDAVVGIAGHLFSGGCHVFAGLHPRKGVLNGVPDAPGRSIGAFVWQVDDAVICSVRERRREPGPSDTTGTTSSAKSPIGMALADLGSARTVTAHEGDVCERIASRHIASELITPNGTP